MNVHIVSISLNLNYINLRKQIFSVILCLLSFVTGETIVFTPLSNQLVDRSCYNETGKTVKYSFTIILFY
jgi:hypothetical protein